MKTLLAIFALLASVPHIQTIAPFYSTNSYEYYYSANPTPIFTAPKPGAVHNFIPSSQISSNIGIDMSAFLSGYQKFDSYASLPALSKGDAKVYYRKQSETVPEALKRVGLLIQLDKDKKKEVLGDENYDMKEYRQNPPTTEEQNAESIHFVLQLEQALGFYAQYFDQEAGNKRLKKKSIN